MDDNANNQATVHVTLANFTEVTGRRFRVTRNQRERIEANTLTREDALQEFIRNGGLDSAVNKTSQIPVEVWASEGLTQENFSERVEALTGNKRRFRMNRSQAARVNSGEITRKQAFEETVAANLPVEESQSAEDVDIFNNGEVSN